MMQIGGELLLLYKFILRNYLENNLTEDNYYIFIYFTIKFNVNYLKYIEEEILKKLNLGGIFIGYMSEEVFEERYNHFILLNALTQSINIGYKDFLNYAIEKENKIPSAIVMRILENEDIDLIKTMIERKIAIYNIETTNMFDQNKFQEKFLQKLDDLPNTVKIKGKNDFLTPKHIIYYLYKSEAIDSIVRKKLIKELANMFSFEQSDILNIIIKMKDQDLAEDLITGGEDLLLDETTLSNSLLTALKFNQPRVAYLLFQYTKTFMSIIKDKKIHRALIRTILEYPENIEIYLYMCKRQVLFFSVSDTIYLLSALDQLTFHKSIEDCKFLRSINPLKTFVLILELVNIIKSITYQVKTKCDSIFDKYMKTSTIFIEESSDKRSLEAIFKDKDLENRELLYIIAINNFLSILKNPTVEHIVAKTWNSTFSSQNNYFDTSTLYQILQSENVDQIKFNLNNVMTRTKSNFKSFTEGFLIWKEGVKVKYYNQIFIFVVFLLFFQFLNNYFISSISPKIELAIQLRQTIKIWLPAFNNYFNGTTFSLNDINQNVAEKNMTFISKYLMKASPELQNNFTLIGQWVGILEQGLDEVITNLDLLNYSSYIYLYIILNVIFRYIYSKLSSAKIQVIDYQSLLDFLIFFAIFFRITYVDEKFRLNFDFKNFDKYDDAIRAAYVFTMSGFFCCLWLKLIVYFKFSDKIGPLLRIFGMIIQSLSYFGIIFFAEFFIFGCIGNLLFALDRVNKDYKSIGSAIIATFRATINDFDYKDFHQDNINIASGFLTIHIIISGIILLNFLIAILSNIYEKFQENSILLFHQEIILKKCEFFPDKNYGALILIPFPFNIINLIFLPFYLCCSSRKKLAKINKFGLYIAYFPLYIVFILIHTLSQILFFPLVVLKLLLHVFLEICNKTQNFGQKSQSTSERIKKSLFCFFMFLISPLIFIYSLIFDFIIYSSCLFEEELEQLYIEEEELITPFILQKVTQIMDKTKEIHLLTDDVIDDFSDEMKLSNEKFDFRNVLLSANHKESLTLVKDYSVFVKFMDKVKLKNQYNESMLNKSLIARLIESNINFCRIVESQKRRNKKFNNKNSKSKIFPEEIKTNLRLTLMESQSYNDEFDDDSSEEEIQSILEMQREMSSRNSASNNLIARLPKLFYHRLYLINLQELMNAIEIVERSDNLIQTTQKIRTDLKQLKKHINKISITLNTKDQIDTKKRNRASVRIQRKSQIYEQNTNLSGLTILNKDFENGLNKKYEENFKLMRTNPDFELNRKQLLNSRNSLMSIRESMTEEN